VHFCLLLVRKRRSLITHDGRIQRGQIRQRRTILLRGCCSFRGRRRVLRLFGPRRNWFFRLAQAETHGGGERVSSNCISFIDKSSKSCGRFPASPKNAQQRNARGRRTQRGQTAVSVTSNCCRNEASARQCRDLFPLAMPTVYSLQLTNFPHLGAHRNLEPCFCFTHATHPSQKDGL
jgi:hypothetical protein